MRLQLNQLSELWCVVMSGEDSGVDAGSNASNDSICMSLASFDSDYERDDFNVDHNHNEAVDEIAVIDINLNEGNPNTNQHNSSDSTENSVKSVKNSCD